MLLSTEEKLERLRREMPTNKEARREYMRIQQHKNNTLSGLRELWRMNATLPPADREPFGWLIDLKPRALTPKRARNANGQLSADAFKYHITIQQDGYRKGIKSAVFRSVAAAGVIENLWWDGASKDIWHGGTVRPLILAVEILFAFYQLGGHYLRTQDEHVNIFGRSVSRGDISCTPEDCFAARAILGAVYRALMAREVLLAVMVEQGASPQHSQAEDALYITRAALAGHLFDVMIPRALSHIQAQRPELADYFASLTTPPLGQAFRDNTTQQISSTLKKPHKILAFVSLAALDVYGEPARQFMEGRLVHHYLQGSLAPTLPPPPAETGADFGPWLVGEPVPLPGRKTKQTKNREGTKREATQADQSGAD